MAFPQVIGALATVQGTNSLSWTLNVPAHSVNDLLVMFLGVDGNPTITSIGAVNGVAWTNITNTPNGTANKLAIWWLRATSAQATDTTVALELATTEQGVTRCVAISAAHTTTAPAVGTAATGSSINPDAPLLNPAGWDVEDTMWYAVANTDAAVTVSTYPSNMDTGTGFSDVSGGGAGAGLHSVRLESAVASLDPNTYAMSATETWVAQTVAIRPAPPAVAAPPPSLTTARTRV